MNQSATVPFQPCRTTTTHPEGAPKLATSNPCPKVPWCSSSERAMCLRSKSLDLISRTNLSLSSVCGKDSCLCALGCVDLDTGYPVSLSTLFAFTLF